VGTKLLPLSVQIFGPKFLPLWVQTYYIQLWAQNVCLCGCNLLHSIVGTKCLPTWAQIFCLCRHKTPASVEKWLACTFVAHLHWAHLNVSCRKVMGTNTHWKITGADAYLMREYFGTHSQWAHSDISCRKIMGINTH